MYTSTGLTDKDRRCMIKVRGARLVFRSLREFNRVFAVMPALHDTSWRNKERNMVEGIVS